MAVVSHDYTEYGMYGHLIIMPGYSIFYELKEDYTVDG